MTFDPFVIPFTAGVVFLFSALIIIFTGWLLKLNKDDRGKIIKGIFSVKIFGTIGEIISESLLHRKIFKINPVLGYMHSSLAFGWFLLIATGGLETFLHTGQALHAPYIPIFFRFFSHEKSAVFAQVMDLFLLYVLSGVLLAYSKRFYSRLFGMKNATRHRTFDQIAMTTLWLIFPLRLAAESFTSAIYGNGGFLTGSIGNLFSGFSNIQTLSYVAWWAYSIVLGLFFISMPFSRYMHILAEIVLISFRKFGLKTGKKTNGFSLLEAHTCSKCGICIDKCQLIDTSLKPKIQSAYLMQGIRYKNATEELAQNCLMCGRCKEYCPVGIDTIAQRLILRKQFSNADNLATSAVYDKLDINTGKVGYFAGCMSHLTPGVIKSMHKIFTISKTQYTFLDEKGGMCCGRPMLLAGKPESAEKIREELKKAVKNAQIEILVTSCPICYKEFVEKFGFNIKIMHHTQFINELINDGKLKLYKSANEYVYHDPCELSRGLDVYDEPRNILIKCGTLQNHSSEKRHSLCCGGSIANTVIDLKGKNEIVNEVVAKLTANRPDEIITSCPLCKKSLSGNKQKITVKDVSEVVAENMLVLK